ncbi:MAG TPA: Wzy polymerase domain-containing protein [Caldimonas sp.]|nr:Wzy polymerase domain-containing protein [Caldimonas sp.]HEX4233923.1 Wzy polymerase domain-containing protein [Caldimonas sp.]
MTQAKHPAAAAGVVERPAPPGTLPIACAIAAVAVPMLIAFNVAPSATFFNQAAAFVGWGAFLLVLATTVPRGLWPRSGGALALLAALVLSALSALAATTVAVPWTLALSSAGTILSAVLAVAVAASARRAGKSWPAFRAFCVALAVAGVASALIGLVQVFAPRLPDGDWIALATIVGRATGNLRQPNHLSSLLLWSVVAVIWLGEAKLLDGRIAAALTLVFVYVVVLSASRTGAIGMLTLAGWGLLDRRLSRRARAVLMLAPVFYAVSWWATGVWADVSHQVFAGQARLSSTGGDISSNRFAIWSNALSLIASHPWLGVGFGDFNFAWTLTPFPGRPTEFFDHTHDLVLNLAVEMGIPLAALVLALLVHALWRALRNAIDDGRVDGEEGFPIQRAAFVIVFLVAVHSMLEYPLWYSYFLLPTAFAFGLCLEQPTAGAPVDEGSGNVTRPYVLAAMFLMLGGTLAVYDYMRVVVIFAPPADAGPLERRIALGRQSVLFGHHADYAAATIAEHPGKVMFAFERAPHYLLDTRLMVAWAKAFEENGEHDKARWIADRLREFRNEQSDGFFAPCKPAQAASAVAAAASAPPFQCQHPTRTFRFEDFR